MLLRDKRIWRLLRRNLFLFPTNFFITFEGNVQHKQSMSCTINKKICFLQSYEIKLYVIFDIGTTNVV